MAQKRNKQKKKKSTQQNSGDLWKNYLPEVQGKTTNAI